MKNEHSKKKKRKREKSEDDNVKVKHKKTLQSGESSDETFYQPNEKFKMKLISRDEDDTGPFLLRFPHGPPPDHILNNGPKGITFQYFTETEKKENENKLEEIRASAPNFQVEYKGRNFGGEEEQILSMNKYFIGIHNKKKGRVKLIEVPHVFAMKQHVTSYKSELKSNKFGSLDKVTQRMLLINSFASTRRKRAFKQSLTNKVNDKTAFGVDSLKFENTQVDNAKDKSTKKRSKKSDKEVVNN